MILVKQKGNFENIRGLLVISIEKRVKSQIVGLK